MAKKEQNISHVHDKFFKENFSQKEVASEFIQTVLSAEICNRLDFTKLEISNASFVDEDLSENFADLVYTIDYQGNNKIQICLLLEHKSYLDEYPHLQLNRYMLNIWQQNIKQKQPLMPTIPMIIYHGKSTWKYRKFADYFKNMDENLSCYVPNFDYELVDLSKLPDDKIMGFKNKFLALSTLLMKYSHRQKYLLEIRDKFEKIVKEIENFSDLKVIHSSFLYIFPKYVSKVADNV
jgi:predicted transposase/invertase (TIGR01784 family)